MRVRRRSRGSVEEDGRQADRRQRRRTVVRVQQQEDRREDEPTARADNRAERTDGDAKRNEPECDSRGERQKRPPR
jgi:hypothetical protein